MANTFKQIQTQSFTLAGAGSSIGDTSIILSSMLTIDGVAITMSDIGDKGFFTIEAGNGAQEEAGTFTGITQNVNGTATLTGVKHQMFEDPYTETSGLTKSHAGGTSLVLSNTAGFYQNFLRLGEENTVTDVITFTVSPIVPDPTIAQQAANKDYVDGVVIAGGVNASSTVKGISKLSSDPSAPTNPIALNSEEVSATSGANKVVRTNGSGKIDPTFLNGIENYTFNGTNIFTGSTTLNNGYVPTSTPTLPGQIVGLDASSVLPAIDGSKLINIYKSYTNYVVAASDGTSTVGNSGNVPGNTSYTKVAEIKYNDQTGTIRTYFGLYWPGTISRTIYGKVYVNGNPVGAEHSQSNGENVIAYFSDDISVNNGDLIQLYTKSSNSNGGYFTNFTLKYSKTVKPAINDVNL